MAIKSYRHPRTGVVFQWPESAAKHYPKLIEVEPDSKPLAYVPISDEAIAAVKAAPIEKKVK